MNNQGTSRQEDTGILTGMFRDRESTESAYRSLRDRGYSDDEINVMMSEDTRNKHWGDDATIGDDDTNLGNKALEGTGIGSAIGGTLGAIIGGVADEVEGEPIVVNGERERINTLNSRLGDVQDAPQSISIISREVIEQQSASTLRDVLRNVSGISMAAGEGGGGLAGDACNPKNR